MTDSRPPAAKVRRAPKFGRFAIIGGAIGAVATLALTSMYPVDPSIGFWPLFAYFALFGVTGGVVLGLVVALIADTVSNRRARTINMEREGFGEPE